MDVTYACGTCWDVPTESEYEAEAYWQDQEFRKNVKLTIFKSSQFNLLIDCKAIINEIENIINPIEF